MKTNKELKMNGMARQGDVLIINEKGSRLRAETKERLFGRQTGQSFDFKKENRLPLAYGEVSGHAHAIYTEGSAELLVSNDVQETLKHLNVTGQATLQHEEHESICIQEGKNAVLIQNQYQMQKIQRAAD
jgi:hypothetical protein